MARVSYGLGLGLVFGFRIWYYSLGFLRGLGFRFRVWFLDLGVPIKVWFLVLGFAFRQRVSCYGSGFWF